MIISNDKCFACNKIYIRLLLSCCIICFYLATNLKKENVSELISNSFLRVVVKQGPMNLTTIIQI